MLDAVASRTAQMLTSGIMSGSFPGGPAGAGGADAPMLVRSGPLRRDFGAFDNRPGRGFRRFRPGQVLGEDARVVDVRVPRAVDEGGGRVGGSIPGGDAAQLGDGRGRGRAPLEFGPVAGGEVVQALRVVVPPGAQFGRGATSFSQASRLARSLVTPRGHRRSTSTRHPSPSDGSS